MKKETEKRGKIERFYDEYLSTRAALIIILLVFFAICISILTPIGELVGKVCVYMIESGESNARTFLITILLVIIGLVGGIVISGLIAAIFIRLFDFALQQLVTIERKHLKRKSDNTELVSKNSSS